MQWQVILALVIGILIVLFPVIFIWYLNIAGIYGILKMKETGSLFEKALPDLTCSTDDDCPKCYVCLNGRCVPEEL